MIDSGLTPAAGQHAADLQLRRLHVAPVLKDFEKQYGVDIRLSTFNDADEALTKIASKDLKFDLYFPSYDSLGRLVQADLLRPLNHDYLTERRQPVAAACGTPGTTVGSRYTVPTRSTAPASAGEPTRCPTDIAGARQPVRRAVGQRRTRGNMAILDDWHTAMAMVLLRNGIYDINTTDSEGHRPGPQAAARAARAR